MATTVKDHCARIMVAHIANATGSMAKTSYANALYALLDAKNPANGLMAIDVCEWCCMPLVNDRKKCSKCNKGAPCRGPWCLQEDIPSETVTCTGCARTNMCPNCVQVVGCVNCQRIFCDNCALVCNADTEDHHRDPIYLTLCSEDCVRKTAKRARVSTTTTKEGE